MGSYSEEECYYGTNGVVRPTFLPLSLKRHQYCPTLSGTPEHGTSLDAMVGIADSVVSNWELLSKSRYDVTKKFYDDDQGSEVFPSNNEEIPCDEKTVTEPPCAGVVKKKQNGLYSQWGTKETPSDGPCCSQWFRAYISKLWMKNPTPESQPSPESQSPPESPPKLKQLTILERELTFKHISPKRLRRISRKRHSATSQFIYSAYVEDTVCELREERHQNVVYSITIRRDGSLPRNGSVLSQSFSDDDIMNEKNTSRHLKGATLDFMVERLSRVFVAENDDVNFLNVFLTTYRTFASPEELFAKLKNEYMRLKAEQSTKNMPTLKSIVRVFRAWLEKYLLDDFQDDADHELLRQLHALAKIHDDVMNDNDITCNDKKSTNKSPSPLPSRKPGVACGAGFADYVAAKLAVVAKTTRNAQAVGSPQQSPTHSPDPTLDVLAEGYNVNDSASKALLSLSSRYVATQLTVIAAKLFHRVQPHHCLAAVASSKKRPQTVRATIDQFNRVVYCVVGTILSVSLPCSQRTKLLRKWIEVAQECRELKNFSSLRAIVSGLRTHALHRLKKSWLGVPQSHSNLLKELTEMNMKDLLLKVGTAKVNTEDSAITRVRKEAMVRREQDMHSGIMHGTVPYLGSFLTDLTYLDTARPNLLEGGLINFEKRRKYFELLAQLQLWQASCRSYQNLKPDEEFMKWFQSITVLTEEQTFQLSETIEAPIPNATSPSQIASPTRTTLTELLHGEYERNMMSPNQSWQKSRKAENGSSLKESKHSQSFSGKINTLSSSSNDKNRIVRIRLVENKTKNLNGDITDSNGNQERCEVEKPIAVCEYKTIVISSDERRAAVIKRALEAFMLDLETNVKRFSLVQVLHDKEIKIPDTANVFYAMSSSDQEPTLILLEDGAEIPQKIKRHQSSPNRPKKNRHRKNNSVSSVLDSESGRASPLSNVASPMKSLYRQIAFGSVALVGCASYSPSSSPGPLSKDVEVAGNDGIVLIDSRSGVDFNDGVEKEETEVDIFTSEISESYIRQMRSSRCHSADFAGGVVLPVRVLRSSRASVSTRDSKSKSAPPSPGQDRKNNSEETSFSRNDAEVLTATGRLIEWPRYSRSVYTQPVRSATWSSRRALKKSKKNGSFSRFYVKTDFQSPIEKGQSTLNETFPPSKSKFYVDLHNALPETNRSRSPTSNTLPPRLHRDYLGHDYDVTPTCHPSASVDESKSSQNWDETAVRQSNSFASVSSTQSHETAATNSDTGSGINFCALPNEDNVFNDNVQTDSSPPDSMKTGGNTTPVIKIQCASPDNFFERYGSARSDNDSQDGAHENRVDENTYL